jgi:hypothetical protein
LLYEGAPNFSEVISFQRTLSRYFDVTHATAQLSPTAISKWNTGMQLLLVATTLAAPVFSYVDHPALHAMWYVVTVLSPPSLKQLTEQYTNTKITVFRNVEYFLCLLESLIRLW